MAAGGLGIYATLPERAQGLMPDWLLGGLAGTAIGAAALIPVATSLKQTAMVRKARRRSRNKRTKKAPVSAPSSTEDGT